MPLHRVIGLATWLDVYWPTRRALFGDRVAPPSIPLSTVAGLFQAEEEYLEVSKCLYVIFFYLLYTV